MGMGHRVDTVTVAIDWRLMVIAMQLRFFVRPLGFSQAHQPRRGGRAANVLHSRDACYDPPGAWVR